MAVTIGKNIGVNINTAGVISMKIPTNKRIVFIIRIIIIGLSLNPKIISFIKEGKSSYDMTQDILIEVAIKNKTILDILMVSIKISERSPIDISL